MGLSPRQPVVKRRCGLSRAPQSHLWGALLGENATAPSANAPAEATQDLQAAVRGLLQSFTGGSEEKDTSTQPQVEEQQASPEAVETADSTASTATTPSLEKSSAASQDGDLSARTQLTLAPDTPSDGLLTGDRLAPGEGPRSAAPDSPLQSTPQLKPPPAKPVVEAPANEGGGVLSLLVRAQRSAAEKGQLHLTKATHQCLMK